MSSAPQDFEFLDLSGVCDEDRQQLLSLFSSDNPAVVLLAPEVENEEDVEEEEAVSVSPVPPSPPPPQVAPALEVGEGTPPTEPLPEDDNSQENFSEPISFIADGDYGAEGKVSVMAEQSPPPPAQVPSITSTSNSTPTTTTTPASGGHMASANEAGVEVGMRGFSVPPPSVPGQGQVGIPHGAPQQVTPQVYHQPYPAASPGNNPPMYNPNMPPPSHPQPPPTSVYSQMPPPPVLPHGATVYVANCHVNLSPYSGTQGQVPVMGPNGPPPPSQSPPPPPQAPIIQSIPIMPEQPPVHMPPMKAIHDKPEFENRRFEPFRGGHRGRGRSRGRGRRMNSERSNSVSSDHSGYGGDKHYNDMGPPQYGPMPGQYMYPNVPYPMRGGGGYPTYQNVSAAQTVQGLPLVYSQPHQYSQYMQYPHHGQGHLVSYQQPPGPHGPQHPAAMQHIHHQPPHHHHHHHPQPHHYHHPDHQQHMQQPPPPHQPMHHQHHPHDIPPYQVVAQQEQTPPPPPPQLSQVHQQLQPPQVEEANYTENTEVLNVDANVGNPPLPPPFVPESQTVPAPTAPTRYESPSSVGVSSQVVNSSPSVTAADSLSPLTTQAAAMTLDDTTTSNNESSPPDATYSPADTSATIQQAPPPTVEEPQMETSTPPVSNEASVGSASPVLSKVATPTPVQAVPQAVQSTPNVKPTNNLPVATKTKTEAKPIVSLNMDHTSISDITFMSDEIQPNVDPQEAVDFSSLPKPVVITPNAASTINNPPPSSVTYRAVPPTVDNTSAAEIKPVPSSVDIVAPVLTVEKEAPTTQPPVIIEVPKKEVVIPEIPANPQPPPTSAWGPPNPQPGGAWAQKKSWSQLFKPIEEGSGAKQVAYVAPFNQDAEKTCDTSPREIPIIKAVSPISEADVDKAKIGGMLHGYIQDHHHVALQPRGLINKGYWCYVNAPLQALMACPPFYNLMKNIPNIVGLKKGKSSTPVIDSIVEYVHEFTDMAPILKPSKKEKGTSGARMEPEVVTGSPFEPSYVYKMLASMGGDMFTEGRQQDAEEMLSLVLNGLHDEMVEALKLAGGTSPTPENSVNGSVNGEAASSDHEEMSEDDDEWQVMGPRKRSCVTRTAHISPSPISAIFWGQLRSVLHQAGGVTTANLQPFTTLPLDIQSAKVESVRDALEHLVSREEIPDFTCSKTNQEVTVSKQVLLETLPTVLILQLKRFIYDKDGGLQKVTKKVNFPIDLEMTKELMSPNSRGKFSTLQRKYKLLAVVYHDGKEATKGHYIADIYHSGYNCWLRYDDSVVKAVSEANVLRHVTPRVPYLLFYRRGDTLVGPSVKSRA